VVRHLFTAADQTNTTIDVGLPDAEPPTNAVAASQEISYISTRVRVTKPISQLAVLKVWDSTRAYDAAARRLQGEAAHGARMGNNSCTTRVKFLTAEERRREHAAPGVLSHQEWSKRCTLRCQR
jgi:hypothetical protein